MAALTLLQSIAQQLIGGDAALDFDQILAKKPHSDDSVMAWHQVSVYFFDCIPSHLTHNLTKHAWGQGFCTPVGREFGLQKTMAPGRCTHLLIFGPHPLIHHLRKHLYQAADFVHTCTSKVWLAYNNTREGVCLVARSWCRS